jgi:hypothetical protein
LLSAAELSPTFGSNVDLHDCQPSLQFGVSHGALAPGLLNVNKCFKLIRGIAIERKRNI